MGSVLLYSYVFTIIIIITTTGSIIYCEAAGGGGGGGGVSVGSSKADKCYNAITEVVDELVEFIDDPNWLSKTRSDGSISLVREFRLKERCVNVTKQLSGNELVLCRCEIQEEIDESKGAKPLPPKVAMVLNALNTDPILAKSCGFDHQDCNAAFDSAPTSGTCEVAAREAMKTCEPMVKAAKENAVGFRDRQVCCSGLRKRSECSCGSYNNVNNPTSIDVERANNLLRIANDTLLEECDFSTSLFTGPVCELGKPASSKNFECFHADTISVQHHCATSLRKPRIKASDIAAAPPPLIDARSPGCCSDKDSCRCDPKSVRCCKKLGELSKNGWKSCMCDLLKNPTKTIDPPAHEFDFIFSFDDRNRNPTNDFLKFVNSNYNMFWSCIGFARDLQNSCKPSHGFDVPRKKKVPTLRPAHHF